MATLVQKCIFLKVSAITASKCGAVKKTGMEGEWARQKRGVIRACLPVATVCGRRPPKGTAGL